MNRFSKIITTDKSQGASQAMLYALNLNKHDMKKAQVGIGSTWFESNPCNNHLNILADKVKTSFIDKDIIGFRYNTIGVSDGISMGTKGMLYSLPSREIIADSYETINIAHSYDGNIAIPGCDKNMPGCLMGMIRINRPSFMIYGGSIMPGKYNNKEIDIVNAFQSYGEYLNGNISNEEHEIIIQSACPGSGSCGGMYTANTMASAIEAMGMTLPGSASNPALSNDKINECYQSYDIMRNLLENNIKPSDIITQKSIHNAITLAIALGGSTNAVLHLLAIAKTASIKLNLEDFNNIGYTVPVLANLKPQGDYLMYHLHKIGGIPIVMKQLLDMGLLYGDCLTINGNTIEQNLNDTNLYDYNLNNINDSSCYNILKRMRNNSHIVVLKGNIAPEGAVAKISGKEGEKFKGEAIVFESENDFMEALQLNIIKEGHVIIIRNQGPKGGPGMPEMLKPTSAIVGYGLENKVAFLTDGRFSGGSHGFIIGHIAPESYEGGPISKIINGDNITIDINKKNIHLHVSENELKNRASIKINEKKLNGYLQKYRNNVSSAKYGCITDN
jgi:dihydroxy-acid dehydratase